LNLLGNVLSDLDVFDSCRFALPESEVDEEAVFGNNEGPRFRRHADGMQICTPAELTVAIMKQCLGPDQDIFVPGSQTKN
jgi:hypothetical protein